MKQENEMRVAAIPMRKVGPVKLSGPEVEWEGRLPLATYESPLWPSVERGARVTAKAGGIRAVVLDERMSRSILVDAPDAIGAQALLNFVQAQCEALAEVAAGTSRFARLKDVHYEVVGHLVYIRL